MSEAGAAAGRPTPPPRSGGFGAQEGLEEQFHIQGQKGQRLGDTPVQGKEQWLRFAGAAVKRYPTSKVRETQVRR